MLRPVALTALLLLLAGASCSPTDPNLEASLRGPGKKMGLGTSGSGGAVGYAGTSRASASANPSWNPRDRIPNTNPRILTNNVYGPGKSSDRYGRIVYHNPGLRIEESAVGTGDYTDQYGRSVRCFGSGMGTFCK